MCGDAHTCVYARVARANQSEDSCVFVFVHMCHMRRRMLVFVLVHTCGGHMRGQVEKGHGCVKRDPA